MSAVLAHEQIDSVIADLELLKDIRRAQRDLRDSEVGHEDRMTLQFSCRGEVKDEAVCYVHGHSMWLANVALSAMEREVLSRLQSKDIEVEA